MPSDGPDPAAWGIGVRLEPLGGGHRNRVLRTRGLARERVFKSTRRSEAALRWLSPVQAVSREAGFEVPGLIPARNGTLAHRGWTCEPFVEGQQLPHLGLPCLALKLAAFHARTAGIAQRPGFCSSLALLDCLQGGDVALDRMPRRLVSRCRDAWRAVADRPETVVHGDLNGANLIATPQGGIALIDWDECRRDLALHDTGQIAPDDAAGARARLAWEIACSWLVEPERARHLATRL